MYTNYKTFTDNLTKEERASITELGENKNILKKSDKGGGGHNGQRILYKSCCTGRSFK